jgi:hypothetical protein
MINCNKKWKNGMKYGKDYTIGWAVVVVLVPNLDSKKHSVGIGYFYVVMVMGSRYCFN